jgi:hypothetical protein
VAVIDGEASGVAESLGSGSEVAVAAAEGEGD